MEARHQRWSAGPLVLLVLLLGGCGAAARNAPQSSPGLTLDGGALVITPVLTLPSPASFAKARFLLTHSEVGGAGWEVERTVFGRVTMGHRHIARAWVFFVDPGIAHCGAARPRAAQPSSATPNPSKRVAMIVDTADGAALVYTGAGAGGCVPAPRPLSEQAVQRLSVPWTDLGDGNVRLELPPCAIASGAGYAEHTRQGTVIQAIAKRPIWPCGEEATTATVSFAFAEPWLHGAIGPIPTGHDGI